MKRLILYIALLSGLLGTACSTNDDTPGSDGRTGTLTLNISATRTQDDNSYDPLQHLTVRIYTNGGDLVRKYTSEEGIPARLELLADNYRVAVEAGESAAASFTKRLYKGEQTLPVRAGKMTESKVVCKPANTIVEVKFDASVTDNFQAGYFAWISGDDQFDEQAAADGSVPALKFTAEGTGYYTLPEGTTTLAWMFRGTHSSRGKVEQTDILTDVKAGGKYILTFKYSPDLPGYIGCFTISVDPSTDDQEDNIPFIPDPTILGDGFDPEVVQPYTAGSKTYNLRTFVQIETLTVKVDGQEYNALDGTAPGITLAPVDKYNHTLTLSDAFFAGRSGGDHAVEINVVDKNQGTESLSTTYRLEGLVPVTETDYSLWSNTVTLRAVSFAQSPSIQFGLRGEGGAWQTLTGVSQGEGIYTATYAPEWESKTAADWSTPSEVLPYTRIKAGTGISAGNRYDYKATIDGQEHNAQFSTEAGAAMTDGSLEVWRSAQQFPGSGTNYTFWGSGYNSFAKDLCTRNDTMEGRVGTYCAKLTATYNTLAKVPAPGNLFTGDFAISLVPMGGNVSFGKTFAYNARPKAIKFKYHATLGTVDYNLHNGKIPVGELDKARVFVCIVDWSAQQKVFAGTKAPTGTWDPETQSSAANGPIVGYASKFIEETTPGDAMVEVVVPMNYYQNTATPPQGKYNIVISCSSSAYGDYMDACTKNVMYIDNFEWVY